jgi:hypothetical protein
MAPRLRELEVGGWHKISEEIIDRAPGAWPHLALLRVRNATHERAHSVGLAIARMRALERFEFFAAEEGGEGVVALCLRNPPPTLRTITLDLCPEDGVSALVDRTPLLEALSVVAPRMRQSPFKGAPRGAFECLRELRVQTAALQWDDAIEIALACPALEAYELHLCDEEDDTAVVAGTIVSQWRAGWPAVTLACLTKEMEARLPGAHPASATRAHGAEETVVLAAGKLRELRRPGHF